MSIKELDNTYVAATYKRFPVEIVSGKGSILTDVDGKTYIDLGSGIGVTAFGAADTLWQEAVIKQIGLVQHTSNLYYTEPCAKLAKRLCDRTGMKKVFFSNSGAEANECAIKVARKYAADRYGDDRHTVITLKNSFHGRTITTLAATGQDSFHRSFQPLTPGFAHVAAGDVNELKAAFDRYQPAGFMFECVQGEGGVIPLDKDYLIAVEKLARERDILLIADEVQTGNGRTGKLYAYMHYGIQPDIISTAKGLAGGLPIGATLLGEKVRDVLGFGEHGSTFGGNPVSCAAAISVIDRIDDRLLDEVRQKSDWIKKRLASNKGVVSVTGTGLMLGIEPVRPAAEIVGECIARGVLCLTAKTKVRLLPALNIPLDTLKQAIEILASVCETGIE